MNLKTRFSLLIMGTFFIPNILIMLIVWLSFGSIENMRTTHKQFVQYYRLYEYVSDEVDRNAFSAFITALPSAMHARLLDAESPDAHAIFTDLIKANKNSQEQKTTLEALTVSFKDGTSAVLIINRPLADKYSIFRNTPFPYLFPFILFSVITMLSLLLIRSINSSLKKIEEATRKVAEGNFEFELTAKGNDSIASLTRSFDIMRRKVKEEYDRRARFFMGVSHDLKTPLASIGGYADAVLEGYAENRETLFKYMEIIRSKSDLLKNRISHLIHFVKLETGDWKAALKPVNLKQFLDDLSYSFSVEAGIYKLDFRSEIALNNDVFVDMDRELVTRCLENLMHNAFRYSYADSPITFRASLNGGKVVLEIKNRGEGIDKENLPNIFEPFYRGSQGRNKDGFGLGLANVAAVIKSHGWKIEVNSEVKKQTAFRILIPTANS